MRLQKFVWDFVSFQNIRKDTDQFGHRGMKSIWMKPFLLFTFGYLWGESNYVAESMKCPLPTMYKLKLFTTPMEKNQGLKNNTAEILRSYKKR